MLQNKTINISHIWPNLEYAESSNKRMCKRKMIRNWREEKQGGSGPTIYTRGHKRKNSFGNSIQFTIFT